jgi:hypothetical protein
MRRGEEGVVGEEGSGENEQGDEQGLHTGKGRGELWAIVVEEAI